MGILSIPGREVGCVAVAGCVAEKARDESSASSGSSPLDWILYTVMNVRRVPQSIWPSSSVLVFPKCAQTCCSRVSRPGGWRAVVYTTDNRTGDRNNHQTVTYGQARLSDTQNWQISKSS